MDSADLRQSLDESNQKLDKVQKALSETNKDLDETKDSLDASKEQEAKLQVYSSDLLDKIKERDAKLEELEKQNQQLKRELDSAKQQLSRSKATSVSTLALSTKTAKVQTLSAAPSDGKKITVKATTYGKDCRGCSGKGNTASGTKAAVGRTIATDPRVIPTGSRVYIEFEKTPELNGFYVAEDTGGAIKGNKIDYYVGLEKDGWSFGHQTAVVTIVSKEAV